MPYEVAVLRSGYCKEIEAGGYDVACTVTLLKGKFNILVDTGSAWEAELIKEALGKHMITPSDIDYVIGSHGHSDHIGNLNLFTNATHIVCHDINKGSIYQSHAFDEGIPYVIDKDISVESTPGHTSQDITVYVHSNSQELGLVAVCGDIFECEEDVTDPSRWQAQSQFPQLQQNSRGTILDRADTIVPGHGAMFKVSQNMRKVNKHAGTNSSESDNVTTTENSTND